MANKLKFDVNSHQTNCYLYNKNYPNYFNIYFREISSDVASYVLSDANKNSETLTPHPLLVLWSRKSRAIPLLPL